MHSNITYKILRLIIPLPSEQILKEKYDQQLRVTKENFLNSNQIKIILEEFRKELECDDEIYSTIAYDSATVDAENSEDNNLFVFNMQPFKGSIKSQIVQLFQNSTGRTDESVKRIIDEITEEGLKYGIHFLFSSTDGETGTNAIHKNFFSYIESLSTTDFDQIVDEIKSYDSLIPISDWYHILKDMRGRYGRNNIAMFPNAPIFNAKELNEYLQLDDLVISAKGPAAMRDDIALHLFNSENLEILAENDLFCPFAFLLPYTIVTIAINSSILTAESRYNLIKVAFNTFLLLRKNCKTLRSRTSRKNPNVEVKFSEEVMCQRTINTLIALGYSLKYYSDDLKISRLFTHTVEYIFGYMRRLSYGKDSDKVAINALAKQQLAKEILRKYNLESIYIRGRINDSDDNIENITSSWTLNIDQISFDIIPQEIVQLMNEEIEFQSTETSKLLNFIHENTPSEVPSISSRKRKGDAIRSRQQAYH